MKKTLQNYIDELLGAKEANPHLVELDTSSKTSIWTQMIEVVAFVIWNFQNAMNLHLSEIDEKIANQKVPNLRWYQNEALRFQYGFPLQEESDEFENGEATDEQIEESKIIKYAAVTRYKTNGGIKISMKIAGENADEELSKAKALAFKAYIEEIQAAGDNITIVNYLPDLLKLRFKICYDPLVLLENGMSILEGNYPVQDAIKAFLKDLPFNGELSVQKLERAILETEGVEDLQNLEVLSKWIEPGSGYGYFQPIDISRIPKSGRFSLKDDEENEDFTGITYINYTATDE